MREKGTNLVIILTTILALGLTIYGERIEMDDHRNPNVVERNTQSNYTNIHQEISE